MSRSVPVAAANLLVAAANLLVAAANLLVVTSGPSLNLNTYPHLTHHVVNNTLAEAEVVPEAVTVDQLKGGGDLGSG